MINSEPSAARSAATKMRKEEKLITKSLSEPIPYRVITKHDKELKPNGNKYPLQEQWSAPGQARCPLEPGTTIAECNDGFYEIINTKGEEMCYRIGEKLITQIKHIIK